MRNLAKMLSPAFLKALALVFSLLALLHLLVLRTPHLRISAQNFVLNPTPLSNEIPNYVHQVFLLREPNTDFPFTFIEYLSIYSAWQVLRPDKIYLHTNAGPDQVARARKGLAGKWSKLYFELPGLVINHVDMPHTTEDGREIKEIAHKADFVRVKQVRDIGGFYMDVDVYLFQDLKPLRQSGFQAVGGREIRDELNSGTFMAKKNSKFVQLWAEQMPAAFDGSWLAHSNTLMTKIANRLISEPGEMLIMERAAFAPGKNWEDAVAARFDLFHQHDDVPSNLEGFRLGDTLPSHDNETATPSWAWNFDASYMLHAFGVDDEEVKITPRNVLERRSNFGRAVYPIAKKMYEQGLLSYDDIQ